MGSNGRSGEVAVGHLLSAHRAHRGGWRGAGESRCSFAQALRALTAGGLRHSLDFDPSSRGQYRSCTFRWMLVRLQVRMAPESDDSPSPPTNMRRGAALDVVQIAEHLLASDLLRITD